LIRARNASSVLSGTALAMVLLTAMGSAQDAQNPSPASSSPAPAAAVSSKTPSATDRVILKVGDVKITQAEFESRIGDIEPQGDPDKQGLNEKDRRRLGDDYASVLMLSRQAVANHLDSQPDISRQLAIARLQILSDAEFASLMRQAQPSQEEIKHYYDSHVSDYEEVQVRRLFIWKQRPDKGSRGLKPEEARARADAILQASAAGHDTTSLTDAFEDSDAGLLDPAPLTFPRGELSPTLEKAAFAAKEGAWSQAQDSQDSIILLQLAKRDRQSLGEVSSLIQKRLQGLKMQAVLDDLKKKAGIWMDEQYFGIAAAPVSDAQRGSEPPSKLHDSTSTGGTNSERKR
jgi:hypothetical protein